MHHSAASRCVLERLPFSMLACLRNVENAVYGRYCQYFVAWGSLCWAVQQYDL